VTLLYNPRAYTPSQKLLDFVSKEAQLHDHKLFQSSGSTGTPKWVALSHSALEASACAVNAHTEATSNDVFGLALPSFHVGGFGLMERARVAKAELKTFEAKWNAQAFVNWIEEVKVSVTSLVPAQIYDIQRLALKVPSHLRCVVVGGGALPRELYFAARSLGWPLLVSYGLSECASQVATSGLDSLKTPAEEKIWPEAKMLSHIQAAQLEEFKVNIKSPALLTAYLTETDSEIKLVDPKIDGAFLLPDKVKVIENTLTVHGRWEEDYKILGEWIRWDWLKKKFSELCFEKKLFLKFELEIFSDERRGNKIVLLCESFDEFAQVLVGDFNREVFPFERITHYYEGNLPRSELGKVQRLKINPICLKEISG